MLPSIMDECEVETDSIGCIEVKLIVTQPHGSQLTYTPNFVISRTTKELKEDMQHLLGISSDKQEWTHEGRILNDSQTLKDAGVNDEDTIEVTETTKPMYHAVV